MTGLTGRIEGSLQHGKDPRLLRLSPDDNVLIVGMQISRGGQYLVDDVELTAEIDLTVGSKVAFVDLAPDDIVLVATTLRNAKTAGVNDWGAVLYMDGEFHESRMRENLEIYDRVGGGDGFATGMAWSFLDGRSASEAVEIGAAHGALTMSTPGDTSMMTKAEVLRAVAAKGARVVR